MDEPDHDDIMKYYDRAEMLINKGYPVPNDDPYELAKILALKEKESINNLK